MFSTLFKVPHHPRDLQSNTSPSSKYHITLFKAHHHPLQSTIPTSLKYTTTLFKVPYHPLQSTPPPSSKYHTAFFKVIFDMNTRRVIGLLENIMWTKTAFLGHKPFNNIDQIHLKYSNSGTQRVYKNCTN